MLVPGGVAFLTSSCDKVNASLRVVMVTAMNELNEDHLKAWADTHVGPVLVMKPFNLCRGSLKRLSAKS